MGGPGLSRMVAAQGQGWGLPRCHDGSRYQIDLLRWNIAFRQVFCELTWSFYKGIKSESHLGIQVWLLEEGVPLLAQAPYEFLRLKKDKGKGRLGVRGFLILTARSLSW